MRIQPHKLLDRRRTAAKFESKSPPKFWWHALINAESARPVPAWYRLPRAVSMKESAFALQPSPLQQKHSEQFISLEPSFSDICKYDFEQKSMRIFRLTINAAATAPSSNTSFIPIVHMKLNKLAVQHMASSRSSPIPDNIGEHVLIRVAGWREGVVRMQLMRVVLRKRTLERIQNFELHAAASLPIVYGFYKTRWENHPTRTGVFCSDEYGVPCAYGADALDYHEDIAELI